MEAKSAVKVGAAALFALTLFVSIFLYLKGYNPNTYLLRVRFNDTKGLLPESVVRMRGVNVGSVKSVQLDQQTLTPLVTLAIQNGQRIPADSEFIIISGILITNPQVEIRPGKPTSPVLRNGQEVMGARSAGPLEALSPELSDTVGKVNHAFDDLSVKLNRAYNKIDRILDQTTVLVTSVNKTVNGTNRLIGDPQIQKSLVVTLSNFKEVSQDARVAADKMSRDLTDIVHSSKGSITNLTTKLGDLLTRIDNTLDDANTIVKKLTEQVSDPRLQQSLQDTTELARTTLARFNQIAADIHQLTGDPQLQSDLKETIQNLKNATQKGEQAVEKVDNLLGKVSDVGSRGKIRLPRTEILANVSERIDPDRFRLDIEARAALSKNTLLNAGLYDLGQDTRLTLQGGTRPNDSLLLRYGLYASKIGVGLEWEPTRGTGIRADLYDTVRPRLDFRGLFRVNNEASVWVGADSLLRHPSPIFGIQIRH